MRVRVFLLSGGLVASCAVAMLACATPNIPEDDLESDQNVTVPTRNPTTALKHDAGSTTSGDTPPSTPTPSAGTSPSTPQTPAQADGGPVVTAPATNACASSANQDTCYSCCETANPKGLPFIDNEWGKCACVSPGVCGSVCANQYCGGQPTYQGTSCDACLSQNDDSCETQAETVCATNADCKPLLTCIDDSKCATKPQ